jgi:uncharacterized protein YeeX (DUF496 family)
MGNESVIISIDIEKGENEKAIDDYTKKIVELSKANKELIAQNKALEKSGEQNSDQYIQNTRQIEINKQKISESTAARKGLIQVINSEDDSIKSLTVRNAELLKQRNQLSTSTVEGRQKIADINAEMEKNNETILANSNAMDKQRANIGNYKSALDGIVPGLGGLIDGIQGATKAGLTFIATPIGAVLAALALGLAAVTAYFKGSEEGQNKWNKVVAVGSAILEQFMNVVEDVGETIVSAFENPKQAVSDLWEFIKQNFINRIVGFVEFIPQVGKAIEEAFSGDFSGALKTTADAAGKVVLGVENITDKVADLAAETAKLVEQGIANGERIAALNAQIDRDERALLVDRAKTGLEVAKLREAALKQEGEARKKVLLEAIALEEQLTAREVGLAKTRRDLAQAELQANGDDKEAKKAVAEATAAVIAAETTAFQNTLRFRKEIRAIDEQMEKERLARIERIHKAETAINELQLQQGIDNAKSVEERVSVEIALEQFKAQELLKNDKLLAEERELIVAQSSDKILAITQKGNADIIADQAALNEVLLKASSDQVQAELGMKEAVLANFIDQAGITEELLDQQKDLRIERIDAVVSYEQEAEMNRTAALLANDQLTQTEREAILQQSQARQTEITNKAALDRYKIETETEKKIRVMKQAEQKAQVDGALMVGQATVGVIREVFGESKAAAGATAVINTAQGVTNALAMSGPPWVGIAMSILIGALGAFQIAKIAGVQFAKGGWLKKFGLGGISKTGALLRGPSHAQGGIPFTVGGVPGFEAEGDEVIMNKNSSRMFRSQLSAMNVAGGGVAFARGGVTRFATGSVIGDSQTNASAQTAQASSAFRDSVRSIMEQFPPIIVTVEDVNARQQEYSDTTQRAVVI